MAEQGQEVHPDNKHCCSSPPLVDSLWYDRDLIPVEEMNTGSNLSTTSSRAMASLSEASWSPTRAPMVTHCCACGASESRLQCPH